MIDYARFYDSSKNTFRFQIYGSKVQLQVGKCNLKVENSNERWKIQLKVG